MQSGLPLPQGGSGSVPVEEAKKTADDVSEPKVALSIPRQELIPMPLVELTPQTTPEPVKLEEKSAATLVETIVFHHKKITENRKLATPSSVPGAYDTLYDLFEEFRSGLPPGDQNNIELCAQKYLEQSGINVLLAFKAAEIDAYCLQAASGGMFEVGKDLVKTKEPVKTTRYVMTSNGLEEVEEIAGRFVIRGHKFGEKTTKKVTGVPISFIDGDRMEVGTVNTLLTPAQQEYLRYCGWTTGNLDDAQKKTIRNRLLAVARLRTELYAKTGVEDLTKIELNFIKKDTLGFRGRTYRDTKIAHFLGEQGAAGANVREILAAEGVQIASEERKKVKEALVKTEEEAAKASVETDTPTQIDQEIERLKSESMSVPRQEEQKKLYDYQIKKLQEKLGLFTRKKILPVEIDDAEQAFKAIGEEIEAIKSSGTVQDESVIDLLAWAGLDTGQLGESIHSLKDELGSVRSQDHLQHQIDTLIEANKVLAGFTPKRDLLLRL